MHISGMSHVPRAKAAAADSTHLPHFPSFAGLSAWTHQRSLFSMPEVHQGLCRKQTNSIVHWHHRVLDVIVWQCCSCTATKQPSMPNPNSCSLLILPSNFLSPLSEISCFDVFFLAIPWPRSWLLCFEHRWLQAALGRLPGSGDFAWEVALPWLAADARGHLSPTLPWTRLCSLHHVALG